jgi:hypothetical protein
MADVINSFHPGKATLKMIHDVEGEQQNKF